MILNKVLQDYFPTWVSSTTLNLICEIKLCFMKSLMTSLYWYLKPVNLLKTKRRLIYRPTSYRAVNTFHLRYNNRSVYDISGTNRWLFSDKNKTHKYSVGRAYSCWMLKCWCITWPVGFKRLTLGCEAVEWGNAAQLRVQWQVLLNTALNIGT